MSTANETTSKQASCEYAVGELVRLKSGGPVMTVEAFDIHANGWMISTTWFDNNLGRARDRFDQRILCAVFSERLASLQPSRN